MNSNPQVTIFRILLPQNDSNSSDVYKQNKIVTKYKIPVTNPHFKHFSDTSIDIVVFELRMCTVLDTICYKCIIFV
jgi:hypothetical protein